MKFAHFVQLRSSYYWGMWSSHAAIF